MTSLVPIQFGADTIEVTPPSDTRNLINLRKCCESFGLDFSSQLKKLRGHAWATMVIITTVAEDGRRREVTMVDLPTFHGWLLSLNAGKIKSEFREKLDNYQKHALQVLADYFSVKVAQATPRRSWDNRFVLTLANHKRELHARFPRCFTVLSALSTDILVMEHVLLDHGLPTLSTDLPDGSIGQRWAGAAEQLGVRPPAGKVPLYLPERGITVNPTAYHDTDLPTFLWWFREQYCPACLPEYFADKKTFKPFHLLVRMSAADNTCRTLADKDAKLRDPVRRVITRAGGKIRVGEEHKALPPSTPSLF